LYDQTHQSTRLYVHFVETQNEQKSLFKSSPEELDGGLHPSLIRNFISQHSVRGHTSPSTPKGLNYGFVSELES